MAVNQRHLLQKDNFQTLWSGEEGCCSESVLQMAGSQMHPFVVQDPFLVQDPFVVQDPFALCY